MKTRILSFLLLFALILPSCRQDAIRFGFNTWVGYGPLYIAEKKGFFSARGLKVSLARMEGTGERRSALVGGRLEGAGSTVDDLIVGAAQGVPARMVLALDESRGADGILVDQTIAKVSDLKGKTIAVQPGFVNHFFLLYVLDKNGLSAKDVIIKPMEPDAAGAAFASHNVDVAVTWEPHLSKVYEKRPDGKILLTTEKYPGVIVDILIFRDDFIASQPEKVKAFVSAWYDSLDFLRENPQEGHRIIGEAMGLTPTEVGEILKGVKFLSRPENTAYYDRKHRPNVYEVAAVAGKLWREQGYITHRVEPARLIDTKFLSGVQ